MNYYERHLGDYAKDTAHLTMIEHGAYGLLLDRYYSTEQGIPADQAHRVARARTREEKQAVDTVLNEFFHLEDGVWINGRAEEEITKAQTKIKAAQENGKRGGRPRKNQEETQQKPTGFYAGSDNETQQKAHQTPDTRHHKEFSGENSLGAHSAQKQPQTDPKAKRQAMTAQTLCESLPGLTQQVAIDYLAYRKQKKAPLNSTSWKPICSEVLKTGVDPDRAIAEAMSAGWTGFKADWYENRIKPNIPHRQGVTIDAGSGKPDSGSKWMPPEMRAAQGGSR